jgi:surface protein
MKIKTLFSAGLVLTSLLASCSSEDLLQGSQNAGTNTLTAYIESQNDSRVSISDEGKFAWSTDDKISVASTSNGFETWSLSKINDDGSADFAAPDATTTANEGVYAVFPETLNPYVSDDDALQITLPAEYDSNKTVPVLTGKYNDGKVDFAHAGGLIRVSFDNVPSYANKFVFSTNNQNIAGGFTIDDNQAINTSTGTNSTITINIAGDDIKDGKITFDVPVPVGTYEGFTVGLYFGDIELASQSTTNSNTIERRDLLVMPTITATDYFAGSNYVVEKVTSSGSNVEMFYSDWIEVTSNVCQVGAIYIDGVKLSEIVSSYLFPDTKNHIVVIVMNDNFNNASYMFQDCPSIDSFDFSHFDTSNVTDMSRMFYFCKRLETLNLSHFNTSKVTNMSYMFGECLLLETLDISNFDTGNVSDMSRMFYSCYKLNSLNLSSFNTNKLTDMSGMFMLCKGLQELNTQVSDLDICQ